MEPTQPAAAAEPMQGKVLYIEDQPVHHALIEAMLAQSPHIQLIKTTTGREGIRVAADETRTWRRQGVLNSNPRLIISGT